MVQTKLLFKMLSRQHFLKIILILFFLPSLALADFTCNLNKNPDVDSLLINSDKADSVGICDLVQLFYNGAAILKNIAGIFFIIMIVIAGLRYATSAGNPDNIKNAKKALTAAIMGLIVFLLSESIILIIKKVLSEGQV